MTDDAAAVGLTIRPATRDDLPAVVALLADDPLGARREQATDPLPAAYWQAFDAIADDTNNELIIASARGEVVGCMQLTYIPHLVRRGAWRCQLEGVRVAATLRGGGVGRQLLQWAITRARARGCRLVQLTTDMQRADARRFYESLGFVASHTGLKLTL